METGWSKASRIWYGTKNVLKRKRALSYCLAFFKLETKNTMALFL